MTHSVRDSHEEHREQRGQHHAHRARPDELHAGHAPQARAHRVPEHEGVVEDGPRANGEDGGPYDDATVGSSLDPLETVHTFIDKLSKESCDWRECNITSLLGLQCS